MTSTAETAIRLRAPSATLAMVLVGQIQFLATLSLVDNTGAVDSTGAEDSWMLAFARQLRSDDSQAVHRAFRRTQRAE